MYTALGKKRKLSDKLADLKHTAVALYEEHASLEIAYKARSAAMSAYDDRIQTLETEIGRLEGTSCARPTV